MVLFIVCGASLDDWYNAGCFDVFLTSMVNLLMVGMGFVLLGVFLIQGMVMGIAGGWVVVAWCRKSSLGLAEVAPFSLRMRDAG